MKGGGKPRQTSDKGTRVVQGGKDDPPGKGLEETSEIVTEGTASPSDPDKDDSDEQESNSEDMTGQVPGKVLEPPG